MHITNKNIFSNTVADTVLFYEFITSQSYTWVILVILFALIDEYIFVTVVPVLFTNCVSSTVPHDNADNRTTSMLINCHEQNSFRHSKG